MKKQFWTLLPASLLFAATMANPAAAEAEPSYTIGICQFVQHDALNAATQGFKDAVMENLEGNVTFNEQNAQGDYSACTAIINGFISSDVDLIMANATASLQTAATATTTIPILGASVTEYGAALQLNDFDGTTGRNISGTSDLAPLKEQASMIQELFPDADPIALLSCSAEPNSEYQIEVMQKELESMGYHCKRYAFSDSNDISSVTMAAASDCEVIYVPTDNTVASNAELIANICIPAKIPVVAGEENTCRLCGVATLSIDYYDLGYTTGEMAVHILSEDADISSMPVAYASDFTKRYNKSICEELGMEIPQDYEALDIE